MYGHNGLPDVALGVVPHLPLTIESRGLQPKPGRKSASEHLIAHCDVRRCGKGRAKEVGPTVDRAVNDEALRCVCVKAPNCLRAPPTIYELLARTVPKGAWRSR
jgi:hypothetical protein